MAANIMQSTNFYANNARFRRISNASNFLSSSTNISIYALSDPNNIALDPLCFLCKHTMCSHKIRKFVYGKNLEKIRNHSTHQHSSKQKRKADVQLQKWSTVEDMLSLKNSRLWKTDNLFSLAKNATFK